MTKIDRRHNVIIGKHNIIMVRFDKNEAGAVACFDCKNNTVMEIPLPSKNIKIISNDDKEYVHIRKNGIFTAHIRSYTYQKILDFYSEQA